MTFKFIYKISFVVVIVLLWSSINTFAQTADLKNFKKLDSTLYSQYTHQNWKKVIKLGEYAAAHNVDYFYLRVRIGIAAYNIGEYAKAAKNLEKALGFNANDKTAQLYLYDSYILLGKETKAYRLSKNFSKSTLSNIYDKRSIVSSTFAGGAYSFSNNFDKNSNIFLNENNDSIEGFNVLIGDKTAAFAGLSFNLGPSISLTTGFNHLEIQKKANFQYMEIPLVFDSVTQESWGYQNYYSIDSIYSKKSFSKTIKQNEIYANVRYQLNKGWAVTAFTNVLLIKSANITSYTEAKIDTNINYQITGEDPVYFTYEYNKVLFNTLDTSFVNYVAGLNVEKDFNNITGTITGSVSNINGGKQYQLGLSAYYFLNPSATIYGYSEGILFSQNRKSGFSENRIILRQKFGGRLVKRLWLDADVIYGNLNNANIDNGYIVYNQVDDMNLKTSASIKLLLNKHIELFVQYQYVSYDSRFIIYTDNGEISDSNIIKYNYQTQNLIGGLKWKF